MVAMTPLITIQILGLYYKHKSAAEKRVSDALIDAELGDSEIFEMEENE